MSEELRTLRTNTTTGKLPDTNSEQVIARLEREILTDIPIMHWVTDLSKMVNPPPYIAESFYMRGTSPVVEGSPGVTSLQDDTPAAVIPSVTKYLRHVPQEMSSEFWEDCKNSPTYEVFVEGIKRNCHRGLYRNLPQLVGVGIETNIIQGADTVGKLVAVNPAKPTTAELDALLTYSVAGDVLVPHSCFFIPFGSVPHFASLTGFTQNVDVAEAKKGVVGWYRGYRVVSVFNAAISSVIFGDLSEIAAVWARPVDGGVWIDEQTGAANDLVYARYKTRLVTYIANGNRIRPGVNAFSPRILYFKTS